MICPVLSVMLVSSVALAQERVVQLELQNHVTVATPHWQLGQVARVQANTPELAQSLPQQVLGRAPQLGNITRLTRADIEHALRRVRQDSGLRIEWQGALALNLRSAQQTVAAEQLLARAQQGLQQALQQRGTPGEVRLLSVAKDVAVPVGQLEMKLRSLETELIKRRMPVCLDLSVDGRFYRALCWVFEVQNPPAMPNDRVLRGAVLTVQVRQGGVVVETRAVVQQDAMVGQMTKIKPLNDNAILAARVHSASLLVIE